MASRLNDAGISPPVLSSFSDLFRHFREDASKLNLKRNSEFLMYLTHPSQFVPTLGNPFSKYTKADRRLHSIKRGRLVPESFVQISKTEFDVTFIRARTKMAVPFILLSGVEVKCYKLEGRRFESRMRWIFSIYLILPAELWPWGRLSP
jgi:hypothetical protein